MTTLFPALLQTQPDAFALGDFWSLTQQAGPLRWPIFFVLAVGLVQVFVKLYELVRDRRVSLALHRMDFATMSLDDITRAVSGQSESMLSSVQSTMLNVFHTRPGEGQLHDEIANFVSFQQDQFGVFRRRMEFLSDTAGALGLMGTVWGMFTVFFQGTAQQDVILRGMGIALITTLLGLVVSIILNFSATELSTFFGKRLEQVSRKSDELRFRLMELAPTPQPVAVAAAPAPAPPAPVAVTPAPAPAPAPTPEPAAPDPPSWKYVELANGQGSGRAGSSADLVLLVRSSDGEPAEDVAVVVAVPGSEGSLGDGQRTVRGQSDTRGEVGVACTLPEQAGSFALDVSLPEQPGPSTRIELTVVPGEPSRVVPEGNNQAAVAGMRLPLPIGVQVTDRYGNPIPGVDVAFAVSEGDGKLGSGSAEHTLPTDEDGFARTAFVLASEAGQNGVQARLVGSKRALDFVAFGTGV
ncbi:MAG: MotA/TolQ/ExbB proton channel family protein [Gemmatimonadota bacterium]